LGRIAPVDGFFNKEGFTMSFASILSRKRSAGVISAAILAAFGASGGMAAHATTLFVPGSTFEVQATNSPDTFTDTVNLVAGSQSLDGGAVTLNISIVPAGGTNEWLVFNYTTNSGGPLSGNEYWSLNQTGLDAAVPVNFIAGYNELLINGVSQPWSYSFFGGYTPASSPIPGMSGTGVVSANPFVAPFPAGPIGQLGAYMSSFSGYVNSAGIDAASVNGYSQALEFQSQAPAAPELSTWVMMILGFGGLGAFGYRRATRPRAVAA
jgi:hypothetical protein